MRKPRPIKTSVWQPNRRRPANRWAVWAQIIRERHGRMPIRSRAPARVLAGNRAVIMKQVERRYFASANFRSYLRLSIAPILRCLNREIRSLSTASTWKKQTLLNRSFSQSPTGREPSSNRELVRMNRWDSHSIKHPGPPAPTVTNSSTNDYASSAFIRIFNRSKVSNEPGSDLRRFAAVTIRDGARLINRIVTERTRLEETARRSFVTRVNREAASAAKRAVSERTIYESSVNQSPGWEPPMNQSGWPIDIEKLTEQVVRSIDGRIVAHRERIGRVF
jgi:hypothetical protein